MLTLDDRISAALYMLKHYEAQAAKCLTDYLFDPDLWLFYMNMAEPHREFLEKFL